MSTVSRIVLLTVKKNVFMIMEQLIVWCLTSIAIPTSLFHFKKDSEINDQKCQGPLSDSGHKAVFLSGDAFPLMVEDLAILSKSV